MGWRIRRALDHADVKVEELARELGVSRSTVSRWMHDDGPVRRIYLQAIALHCNVPLDWLTTGAVPSSED